MYPSTVHTTGRRSSNSTQGCPPQCQGCSEPPLTHRQTQANGRQRGTVAPTGENGFVSVLESTPRDFQLLRTHKVGWDFLQGEKTAMRKSPLLPLVSPAGGRPGCPAEQS